jgi:hypothetical protein
MAQSKSKSNLSTEEVCRTFYETQLFGQTAAEFFDAALIRMQALDASINGTDRNTFFKEFAAANIELFGVAWLNHLGEHSPHVTDGDMLEEIGFTKRFLQNTGRADIWETMSVYNDALAEAILFPSPWPDMERFRDVARLITDEGLHEEQIRLAGHLAGGFHKHTTDRECVARLVVRCLAMPDDTPGGDMPKLTALSQTLGPTLANRVGLALGASGLFGSQTMIVGLYENAAGFLGAIRDYGSYEAAQSARITLIEHMIRHVTPKKPGDSHRDLR